MKNRFIGVYTGIALLVLLSACGPANSTPVSSGPVGVAPSPTPTYLPPVVQVPLGLKPACTPPDVTIKVTSFCANPGSNVGGATVEDPSGLGEFITVPGDWNCTYDEQNQKTVCSGPSGSKTLYIACDYCLAQGPISTGDYQCQKGLIKKNGKCAIDQNGDWITCNYASHWDNATQTCLDNVTGKPIPATDICQPGYPYYDAAGYCYAKPILWEAFNCQYFPVTLGDCSLQQNKQGVGGAGSKSCPAGTSWNGRCCESSDHRCSP